MEIILEWSQSRPEWQRDALRRIVAGGALGESDIQELVALCKKEHGDDTVQLAAKPLTKTDLPANPGTGAAITLASIAGVEGVNQLAPNQELPFEPKGLTIIYGDNGAGKSGYARVLKRACRARFPGEIMPDAYHALNRKPATAAIGYARGGSAKPAIQWVDDGKPQPVLSAVNVFDRESGAVHVREKNAVAFRPFGLDIPDDLAAACQAVKTALGAEQAALESARDAVFSKPTWKPGTEVGKILSALSATTKLDRLEELAKVSHAERERHRQLAEDLAKDPVRASSEQTLYADELHALAALLTEAGTLGGDGAIEALWNLSAAVASKRAAATVVADGAFAASALPGVGGDAWRNLWESARRYSAEAAYPTGHFPPCDQMEACVLCQQPLSDEARARMARFEAYVRSDVEQQAQDAEAALTAALKDFDRKRIRIRTEARRRIALGDHDLARDVLRYLATARCRRALCRRAVAEAEKSVLPPMPASPVTRIQELEAQARTYAAELLSAADLEGRARLEAERDALADRLALETLLDKAKDEVERLKALKLLAACAKDTSTTAITHLGNAIADEVVTPRIRDRFQEEIVRLAAARVRVEIVRAGGKYGSPVYQVKLFANKDAPVHMVLSEGEQTCVALAAFITELATASHQSALVFDDPVSSLDHLWRGKVAERLVDEAKVRQVIVFTHDLVFVNDLKDGADGNVPVKLVSLSRGPSGAGIVTLDLPWVAASVQDRVDKMEKDARAARTLYDNNDDAGYRDAVHRIYSNLRRTWERALEDVAFGGVIQRHRDYINAKNLRRATAFEDKDYQTFSAGFQKCSDWIDGHDGSRGRNAAPPTPNDLLADIKAVRDWVDDLKKRQKALA
ncbi:AAA family ATPase [Mesorhizobium sp.]|uniref:AAA family ATPase n=1 Tax=Mesorhizobium sp. TaxID=1871066 RepID=UPI002579C509|nr:AAA family ATPase [Mesorhizobium sp.]